MNSLALKRSLLASPLGHLLIDARSAWQRLRAPAEQAGFLAQAALAERILPRLANGGAFVDVGSHIGSVISAVRRASPGTPIIAIEAVPEKAAALQRLYPDAKVYAVAAGERDDEVEFTVDDERPGFSGLGIPGGRRIRVSLRQLDALLAETSKIDILKIDVEGAELGVLRGAAETLRRWRPIVLFESGLREVLGYTQRDLFGWFEALDYQIFVPNRVAHDGPSLSLEGFLEAHHYPRRTLNFFAVPRERRTEARDRARRALGIRTWSAGTAR